MLHMRCTVVQPNDALCAISSNRGFAFAATGVGCCEHVVKQQRVCLSNSGGCAVTVSRWGAYSPVEQETQCDPDAKDICTSLPPGDVIKRERRVHHACTHHRFMQDNWVTSKECRPHKQTAPPL